MSWITGYLQEIATTPANALVKIRAVAWPVIRGNALTRPGEITVTADPLGFWQVQLGKGAYEISAAADNGQTAKVTISLTEDDDDTYSFEEKVVSSLPLLEAPVGGDQPTASANVLGIVKTDETVADPVVATGWFFCANVVALRAKANASNNKIAFITATDQIFKWSAASTATADDSTVVKPDDTDAMDPGRWLEMAVVAGGGGGGGGLTDLQMVDTRTALKAIPSTVDLKAALILQPEVPGLGTIYRFAWSDATTPDDFTVIAANDGLGNWLQRL